MSEAELHILKQRMNEGRLSKARRGELKFALPVGYVWDPDGQICFDPDEQVQAIVRLIFRKFEEIGTLGGLLRYLVRNAIQIGSGSAKARARAIWCGAARIERPCKTS